MSKITFDSKPMFYSITCFLQYRICNHTMCLYSTSDGIFQATPRYIETLGLQLVTLVRWKFSLRSGNLLYIFSRRTSFCRVERKIHRCNAYNIHCDTCDSSPYFNLSTMQGKLYKCNRCIANHGITKQVSNFKYYSYYCVSASVNRPSSKMM